MSLNLIEGQDRTDLASVNDLPRKLGPDPHGHLDAAAAVVTHLVRVTGRLVVVTLRSSCPLSHSEEL